MFATCGTERCDLAEDVKIKNKKQGKISWKHVAAFTDFIFQGCSGDERVMGRAVSDVLTKGGKQVVMEGQEPAEFWVALGGKAPYTNDR